MRNLLHALRYWTLPDGRAVQWSVSELVTKKEDELIQGDTVESYFAIGAELSYEPLGMLPDDEFRP